MPHSSSGRGRQTFNLIRGVRFSYGVLYRGVAQPGPEHMPWEHEAGGSNPLTPTFYESSEVTLLPIRQIAPGQRIRRGSQ